MEMSNLYSTVFEVLSNIENTGVLIIIKKVDNLLSLKFRIDKEIPKINIDKEIKQIYTEDGTSIEIIL